MARLRAHRDNRSLRGPVGRLRWGRGHRRGRGCGRRCGRGHRRGRRRRRDGDPPPQREPRMRQTGMDWSDGPVGVAAHGMQPGPREPGHRGVPVDSPPLRRPRDRHQRQPGAPGLVGLRPARLRSQQALQSHLPRDRLRRRQLLQRGRGWLVLQLGRRGRRNSRRPRLRHVLRPPRLLRSRRGVERLLVLSLAPTADREPVLRRHGRRILLRILLRIDARAAARLRLPRQATRRRFNQRMRAWSRRFPGVATSLRLEADRGLLHPWLR
jgi:hypothetical protein